MIQDKTFTNKASHIDNRNREKYLYFYNPLFIKFVFNNLQHYQG